MDPIAIVGMGCLFPGARTPDEFWQNLIEEKDTTSLATAKEMGVDPSVFFEPLKGRRDKYYWRRGGYIRSFTFDLAGYRLPPEFLAGLDGVFKWALYVSRQALQDSGYLWDEKALAKCGIILGNLSFPTRSSHRLLLPIYHRAVETYVRELLGRNDFHLEPLPGSSEVSPYNLFISGYPAAVVAKALSLFGVNVGLDAACATSLYAVKLACDYLRSCQADLMLAGAVSCADPLFVNMGFSIAQAYPGEGAASLPLDKSSQGLISGEGAGMLVLKRYDDALRDGDRIYALIRGLGLSNDGRGKHLLTPNPKGQKLAFERAYAEAGVTPQGIDFVECHATGTPLGDVTELSSMEAFFGPRNSAPLIGSVKSNFGHLLTTAGMAGIIKTVLAISKGMIPATINLKEPLASQNNVIASEQIVKEITPWPNDSAVRRAGVNAFGFGGVNAHLILEHQREMIEVPRNISRLPQEVKVAIVGMEAFFGSCCDLESFHRSIYEGTQHFIPLPPERWKGIEDHTQLLRDYGFETGNAPLGAYIEGFEIDFLHFRIPPNQADQPIPQHLLMLKIADNALRDAGIAEGSNVAVIVAMGTELSLHQFRGRVDLSWQIQAGLAKADITLSPVEITELVDIAKDSVHPAVQVNQYASFIGNIIASRISAQWDFSGPSFTVSAEENSVFKALDLAQRLLTADEVEAVVVGAVDLSGGAENLLLRNRMARINTGTPTLSYDSQANGWLVGEGAGAVVLKRHDRALQARNRIYAVIEALALLQGRSQAALSSVQADTVAAACRQAFAVAKAKRDDIGYVEVYGSGVPQEDEAEIQGLLQAYAGNSAEPSCALGSIKANIGHTFSAAGMAGLIKTALCLYHRFIPATAGWSRPKAPAVWQDSPFYVPTESRPWFLDAGRPKRVAAINGFGLDGTCAHLVVSEEPRQTERSNHYLTQTPFYLFPLAADNRSDLLSQLDELERAVRAADSLTGIARQFFTRFQSRMQAIHALALLGHTPVELSQEIERARTGVARAFEQGVEWQTPIGSCFTAKPLGPNGKVAFVYPGAFNSYLGLGRDIFHLFPQLHDHLARLTSDPGRSIGEKSLYPRSMHRLSTDQLGVLTAQLRDDAMTMVESGTTFSILYTQILRDCFKAQPAVAFGYSLGEAAMMWALGVWTNGGEASKAFRDSTLFKSRLTGAKTAVREYWGLNRESEVVSWSTYVLTVPAAKVAECLKAEKLVYLAIINTPEEVVIAGDAEKCQRIIEQLHCDALRAPFNHVLHCEPMRSAYDELARLHRLPIRDTPPLTFYSAAEYAPVTLDSETIARNIAAATCRSLDFPRLVHRVFDSGVRIFLELGAGRSCSRWIDAILNSRPHVALSINRKGVDDHTSILRMLAKLVSHRVPLNLSPLYSQTQSTSAQTQSLIRHVTLGGNRISTVILTEANRRKFKDISSRKPLSPHRSPLADHLGQDPQETLISELPTDIYHHPSNQAPIYMPSLEHRALPFNLPLISSPSANSTQAHISFLRTRHEASQQMSAMMRWQMALIDQVQPRQAFTSTPLTEAPLLTFICNEADLLEFAQGEIARVFGADYAVIDTYKRRVRLPSPPYLLASRVTKLEAEKGRFQPSSIITEYDIPHGAWYLVDGQIPWAVVVEAGQCDLLLISFIGIDFENKGNRIYRLLDTTLTFLDDLPKEGQTLRYDIHINSFVRSGDNLLFFFNYECYVGHKMILKMTGGCAGFFSEDELAQGKGVIVSESEQRDRDSIRKRSFVPLLKCDRTVFDSHDLRHVCAGNLTACFGPHYDQNGRNPSLRLHPQEILMIDRIVSIDPQGGPWGLGLIIAEKNLDPMHWYFPCHFKDDPVLAGSLMAEGCVQLMQFYLLFVGVQTCTVDARFQPIPNWPQVVRCRGQVTPAHSLLTYRMEVTAIGLTPSPYAKANVDIIVEDKTVVRFKDLGLQLSEKNPLASPPEERRIQARKPVLFDESHIEAFAAGPIVDCFGPEYAIYETRRMPRTPNGDLKLLSRVLEFNGCRHELKPFSSLVTEYDVPADPWFCRQNACPTTPYSIYMEFALQPCGFLSIHLGSPLVFPEESLYFRNLDGKGRIIRAVDLRGKTITSRVRLLSSTSIQGAIIQKFDFQLTCEEELFYEGDATFGLFTPQALENQVGLDAGREVLPWLESAANVAERLRLHAATRHAFYGPRPGKPHYRLAQGQLDFLDEALIVENGGWHQRGYVYAHRTIDPNDWFFTCHFYQDPVMPGSLGVEAMMQAMQIYALQLDLGKPFKSPCFEQVIDHPIVWKYRGQIVPDHHQMRLEVHLTSIERTEERVILIGEASLWRDNLRIYEVKHIALSLQESKP